MNKARAIAIVVAKVTLGASLALGFLLAPQSVAHADACFTADWQPVACPTPAAGDDNGDGVVMEDESGWSCVDDGNRVCGPGNSNGVTPACYDDGGVIVALWPCHTVVNADGSADVYYGAPAGADNR